VAALSASSAGLQGDGGLRALAAEPRAATAVAGGREPLTAARDAPLGGQAVLEGVMMRGVRTWAVAVRKPSESGLGDIEVQSFPLESWARRHRVYRLPIVRGVVALAESLAIGLRALGISANAQLPEGEGEQVSGATWAITVVIAVAFAVGLFFIVPLGLAGVLRSQFGHSSVLFWIVEGALRTAIFVGYLALLTRIPDLRRVLEYHGAEHKVISCFEAGDELTPERAGLYSRLHPRCGTSFLLVVMLVAIIVFAPIGVPAWYLLLITRVIGVPLIAGVSFEIIKWAGRNRTRSWVRALMAPGMALQRLTTREPDHDQLSVSIAALDAVLAIEVPGEASAEELVGLEVVA
jgi:uncharacterized protein YqhQ